MDFCVLLMWNISVMKFVCSEFMLKPERSWQWLDVRCTCCRHFKPDGDRLQLTNGFSISYKCQEVIGICWLSSSCPVCHWFHFGVTGATGCCCGNTISRVYSTGYINFVDKAKMMCRIDLVSTHTNTHTTILQPSWILSGTTQLSRHQKSNTRKVKPVWIYWSKR